MLTVSTADSPMLPSFDGVGAVDVPSEANHGDFASESDSDVLSGNYLICHQIDPFLRYCHI
jgi:hypothetical protein